MNTNNPDILFFVRREYGAPSIELRAYKVEKVNNEFAFLELERLRLVVFPVIFSLYHFITSTVKTTVCIIVLIIYRI